jgi:hypothetical protein
MDNLRLWKKLIFVTFRPDNRHCEEPPLIFGDEAILLLKLKGQIASRFAAKNNSRGGGSQ